MKINTGNSNKVVRAGFQTDGWQFKPLKEFVGKTIPVNGFFTTLGKYGEQAVIIGDGVLVNMPGRCVEELNMIKNNKDYVDALMDGKMTIQNIRMEEFKNGTGAAYDIDVAD